MLEITRGISTDDADDRDCGAVGAAVLAKGMSGSSAVGVIVGGGKDGSL
jgi:hypothetical protein